MQKYIHFERPQAIIALELVPKLCDPVWIYTPTQHLVQTREVATVRCSEQSTNARCLRAIKKGMLVCVRLVAYIHILLAGCLHHDALAVVSRLHFQRTCFVGVGRLYQPPLDHAEGL